MKKMIQCMFAAILSLFMGAASAANGTLGPGDVVRVGVYGMPDMTIETRVTPTGSITFPLIGQVQLSGLEVPAAERKIADMLEKGGFVKKPQVSILVTGLSSQQVSVLGQVQRPGRYPIEGRRTVLDMLALAGGMAPDGADAITLIRKRDGKVSKESLDIVGMMRTGELQRDVELTADDIIYVERAPRFYIYGEVQRPGAFRLEREMTVLQALAVGGGLTPRGTERGIRVKRRDAAGKVQLVDVKHDELLQVDDVVYVKESLF